jgi:hypothetical protein
MRNQRNELSGRPVNFSILSAAELALLVNHWSLRSLHCGSAGQWRASIFQSKRH